MATAQQATPADVIAQVRTRRHQASRWGLGLASAYLRRIEATCSPKEAFGAETWADDMKRAEQTLTWCQDDMAPEAIALAVEPPGDGTSDEHHSRVRRLAEEDWYYKGAELTAGAIMEFDAVLTSRKRDRDRDILDPKGARLDPNMPLLWQHVPSEPIGKFVKEGRRNGKRIHGKLAIADTTLGVDAAVLAEFGALRISHGFVPDMDSVEEIKEGEDGWLIKAWEMIEVSLVSVPSNTDAVITAFSRGKLHHPAVKAWAKGERDARPVQVPGKDFVLAGLPMNCRVCGEEYKHPVKSEAADGCCEKCSESLAIIDPVRKACGVTEEEAVACLAMFQSPDKVDAAAARRSIAEGIAKLDAAGLAGGKAGEEFAALLHDGLGGRAIEVGVPEGWEWIDPDWLHAKRGDDGRYLLWSVSAPDLSEAEFAVFRKSIIPHKKYPLVEKDTSWDAGAARKRLREWATDDGDVDASKYGKAFTVLDGVADNLTSYKLPHHDVDDGSVVTVFRALAAAVAVLNGGRGGADISDADRAGAYAHLAKHYKEFDEEAPPLKKVGEYVITESLGDLTMTYRAPTPCGVIELMAAHDEAVEAEDDLVAGGEPKAATPDGILLGSVPVAIAYLTQATPDDRKQIRSALDALDALDQRDKRAGWARLLNS